MVHAHEAILATGRVAVALRRNGDPGPTSTIKTGGRIEEEDLRVDGTEVPLYSANLLLEELVPEPRLEFTLPK